jgi:hypothetical protein
VTHVADSILTSVKKNLGYEEDDTSFDPDIRMFTNTVLATLNQIGVGPENGFQIEDKSATWDDLLGATDPRLNFVQTYVYVKVRLIFDPPTSSFGIKAMEDVAKELEVRIYLLREADKWIASNPSLSDDDEDIVLDGGTP